MMCRLWNAAKASAWILLCLMISACASSPEVVTRAETVEVIRERLVPVDPQLTRAQPWPDMDVKVWRDVAVLGIHYRDRWQSCEIRMEQIRNLGAESDRQ